MQEHAKKQKALCLGIEVMLAEAADLILLKQVNI